jgi:hypothetical protein
VNPTAATTPFKITLEECMLKQKNRMPDLEVPRIFLYLRDALFKMEGTSTEGIFRVPANTIEIAALKESLAKVFIGNAGK